MSTLAWFLNGAEQSPPPFEWVVEWTAPGAIEDAWRMAPALHLFDTVLLLWPRSDLWLRAASASLAAYAAKHPGDPSSAPVAAAARILRDAGRAGLPRAHASLEGASSGGWRILMNMILRQADRRRPSGMFDVRTFILAQAGDADAIRAAVPAPTHKDVIALVSRAEARR